MNQARPILALDIGSTWTKGALFLSRNGRLTVAREATTPTTTDDLCRAFGMVCDEILSVSTSERERALSEVDLAYTSSAKGGLSIAASGIVPELTAQAAREAALSAGGKVTRVFSYRLTAQDMNELQKSAPDILLLCGGTDGGNEEILRHNVGIVASSEFKGVVLFAGNRAVAQEAFQVLTQSGKECVLADNVLPNLEQPQPDGAHEAIRTIFLSSIITGKGLNKLVEQTGHAPWPTPLAMLHYVETLHRHTPAIGDFCLVDLGGATTDYYSASPTGSLTPGALLRGLPEAAVKRSVEGDLGMRVSAASLFIAAKDIVISTLDEKRLSITDLEHYVSFVSAHPEHLPRDEKERELDAVLARCAVQIASKRHAGRMETVQTANGPVPVQKGKDLRGVQTLIGTGGFLARSGSMFHTSDLSPPTLDEAGREILAARPTRFYIDLDYRFPLLAAASRLAPNEAAATGLECLTLICNSQAI